jgi:ferredoxin
MAVTVRLGVDFASCDSHGLCVELVPELIEPDEWGFPVLRGETVSPRLLRNARRAVTACPVLALWLLTTGSDRTASEH